MTGRCCGCWLRHRSPGLTGFAKTVSTFAGPTGVQSLGAVVVLAVAVRRRQWWPVLLGIVCMGGAQLTSSSVKRLVARPRPSVADRVAHVSAHGLSFPSGHATAAAAGFTLVAVLLSPLVSVRAGRRCLVVVVAATLIVLVGWSRVYLGVHWPTDVVGGWLLGLGWTLGSVVTFDQRYRATAFRGCRAIGKGYLTMTPQLLVWAGSGHLGNAATLVDGDAGDFRKVNDFARHTAWLHDPAVAYANDGVVLFGVLLLIGWWLARRAHDPRMMARALLAPGVVLLAVAVNQPIVHAVNEPRPYTTLTHTLLLVHRSADASFPSDHATMAGAVAAGLLLVSVRLGLSASLAALLMAFTRVYVGAHYPVDVLAGLAVGATVALLVGFTATGPVQRLVSWATTTRLRPLLIDAPPTEPAPAPQDASTAGLRNPVRRRSADLRQKATQMRERNRLLLLIASAVAVCLIAGAVIAVDIDAKDGAAALVILNAVSWLGAVATRRQGAHPSRPIGLPRSGDQVR